MRRFADNQEALGRLNGCIEETFSGNLVIKALNQQQDMVANAKALNENLFQASKKAMFSD